MELGDLININLVVCPSFVTNVEPYRTIAHSASALRLRICPIVSHSENTKGCVAVSD
jgi:hypothetical protein